MISINDYKTMFKEFNMRTNIEIIGAIINWVIWMTIYQYNQQKQSIVRNNKPGLGIRVC
jgi:hypothetical protein